MSAGEKQKTVLARCLREHRRQHRLTGPELAERLGVTQGTISKIENARLAPTIDYLSRFAHALRLKREQTQELIRLAGVFRADAQPAEFLQFLPYDFLNVDWAQRRQKAMAGSEQDARIIRGYQPFIVPGLLQTPEYARRILSLAGVTHPRGLERGVAARMERQRVLMDTQKKFVFLLHEAALSTRIGTKSERDRQVKQLAELARRPNLRIGIIPACVAVPVLPPPAFYVFDSERVYLELPHGDLWLLPTSHAAPVYLALLEKLVAVAAFDADLEMRLEQIRHRLAA